MKKSKLKVFVLTSMFCLSACSLSKENNLNNKVVKVSMTSTPTPTATPVPTSTPKPTATPVPTSTPTPQPTATPVPTSTPTPTATPVPTATPTPKIEGYNLPIYKIDYDNTNISTSKTIKVVNSFDYFSDSVTDINKEQMTLKELKNDISQYGTLVGNIGMTTKDYKETMNYKWKDCTEYEKQYDDINIDLNESYTYENLVEMMKKLSRIDGVYLYKIGESTAGNDMFAIEIDRTNIENPETIILTGTVHARETAGSQFIIKELVDLLNNKDENEIVDYLNKIKIVAVPCVNPDGREGVAFDTKNYTYGDGQLWKATSNGTDLNRNFPGLSWGQCKKGYSRVYGWSDSNGSLYYPGDSAGSCSETRALMKFLYHYVVVEQASTLIDYHQQGRIAYAGKPWQTKEQEQRCINFAKSMFNFMNKGNSYKYEYMPENIKYGLQGEGSTLTDFACSLAVGAKFSRQYGFYVMYENGQEYPLISFSDLDNKKFEEANSNFRTMTFEIGIGRNYLGYSDNTRKLLNKEYYDYHFDSVLYEMFYYVLENSNKEKQKTKIIEK